MPGQIDFDVSTSVNGAPPTPSASFQVLVEPDGTTGNYVLLDKITLQPIATVSTAGTEVKILNGIVSTNVAQLPPDVQKLVADVFAQKFSDLSNPVTKLASSLGSGTPPDQLLGSNQTGNTQTGPTTQLIQTTLKSTTTPVINNFSLFHVPEAPNALATSAKITVGLTTDLATTDQVAGTVTYADINAGDRPTVSIAFDHFTYTDAGGKPITQLSNLQLRQPSSPRPRSRSPLPRTPGRSGYTPRPTAMTIRGPRRRTGRAEQSLFRLTTSSSPPIRSRRILHPIRRRSPRAPTRSRTR